MAHGKLLCKYKASMLESGVELPPIGTLSFLPLLEGSNPTSPEVLEFTVSLREVELLLKDGSVHRDLPIGLLPYPLNPFTLVKFDIHEEFFKQGLEPGATAHTEICSSQGTDPVIPKSHIRCKRDVLS